MVAPEAFIRFYQSGGPFLRDTWATKYAVFKEP